MKCMKELKKRKKEKIFMNFMSFMVKKRQATKHRKTSQPPEARSKHLYAKPKATVFLKAIEP